MDAKKEVTPSYLFDTATYVMFLDRDDFRLAKYYDISLQGFSCFCNKPMNIGDVLRVEVNLKMMSGGLIDDIHPHIAKAEFVGDEIKNDKTIYRFKFVDFAEGCFDNLIKAVDYLEKKKNMVALADFADDNIQAQQTVEDLVSYLSDHIQTGKIPMPVLPVIVEKINTIIEDPNAGTDDLAAVVETDAVISAKILSIANSAFYNTTSYINSVKEAVLRLGTLEIQT
ncbi:MAG: HDOD domain-containing protein, partial [Desulfobacteraceae bacterium]|nr:HDOD domain-containing protein [Desulfobacteraceae bacterium]